MLTFLTQKFIFSLLRLMSILFSYNNLSFNYTVIAFGKNVREGMKTQGILQLYYFFVFFNKRDVHYKTIRVTLMPSLDPS